MTAILFLDTETTGFKKPGALIQPDQARVCQIGMILADENGKSLAEFSALFKPDGWIISDGAKAVHGITEEICEKYGMKMKTIFRIYKYFYALSDIAVAHNADFDRGFMDIENAYQCEVDFPNRPWICTIKTNTHFTGGKWPKLSEALKYYCQRDLGSDAHDAMNDVRACKDIYFAMKKGVS